jgi:outer membrane receptor protein involved in Fe transport
MNLTGVITDDGYYGGYDFSPYAGSDITYPVNIGGQKNWGIEASVSQWLDIVSPCLKNFQVYAAYTCMDGTTTAVYNSTSDITGLAALPGKMPALGVIPSKYKINLNFSRGRVNASLSYSWVGHYIPGSSNGSTGPFRIGPGATNADFGYLYQDSRGTLDGSFQFAFYKNYRFYIEAKNLANAPVRRYFINKQWMNNYDIYGAFIYFGIKGAF